MPLRGRCHSRVLEQVVAPAGLAPGQRARRPGTDGVVDRGEEPRRLIEIDQADPPERLRRPHEGDSRALDVEGALERPDPEPEALVDRALGRPQDRDRFAALASLVEQPAHHHGAGSLAAGGSA